MESLRQSVSYYQEETKFFKEKYEHLQEVLESCKDQLAHFDQINQMSKNLIETLDALIEKKYASLKEEDQWIKKNKVYKYLRSKGYESEFIQERLKQM